MSYKIGVYRKEDEVELSGKSIPVVGILTGKTPPADFKRFAEMAGGKVGFGLAEARDLLNQRVRVVTDQMPDALPLDLTGKVNSFLYYRPDRGYIVNVKWNGFNESSLHWFNKQEFDLWLEVIPDDA